LDERLLAFFKALSSENRQQIMLLFVGGKRMTVNEIAEAVGLGQSTASEQLAILKRAGLLTAEKAGKEVRYGPNKENILSLVDSLSAFLGRCCDCE